jgi:hypothetical protein
MPDSVVTREYTMSYGVPVALILLPLGGALILPDIYQLTIPAVALGVGIGAHMCHVWVI